VLDAASEVDVATRRGDGTLRRARTVWLVRHGDGVYVRSVNGVDADWYRGALTCHEGQLNADTLDREVRFVELPYPAGDSLDATLDAAYRDKYQRWPGPVAHITAEKARQTTLRLDPA
jgi:hypothetical protein